MTKTTIHTAEQYDDAKEQLKVMFNQDACLTNMYEANDLMKAMDCFEKNQAKLRSTCSFEKVEA